MKLSIKYFLRYILFGIFLFSFSYAQSAGNKDNLSVYYLKLKNLQNKNASVLTPDLFKITINNFKKANDAVTNSDTAEYKRQLDLIKENLSEMEKTINKTQSIFDPLFASRQQALRHGGKKYAKNVWNRGEKYLNKAVKALNENKRKKMVEYASAAVENYKLSEFQAFKQKYLSGAIISINKAKKAGADKWAPLTYSQAIEYMKVAELIIKNDPYNIDKIKKIAAESEREAKKAEQYAVIISKTADDPRKLEELLIKHHKNLSDYCSLLGIDSDSLNRINNLDSLVYLEIEKMVNERKMLVSEINSNENELRQLKVKIDSCRRKQQREEDYKRKIVYIKNLFKDKDAQVVITDQNIKIIIFGMTFAAGNTFIPPEHFGIINDVIQAVKEFGNPAVVITAHTDSRGNARKNKQISEKQANAVKEYILQNMETYKGVITAEGMGESRPIASNATKKGRAMNRRIEIIIQLNRQK